MSVEQVDLELSTNAKASPMTRSYWPTEMCPVEAVQTLDETTRDDHDESHSHHCHNRLREVDSSRYMVKSAYQALRGEEENNRKETVPVTLSSRR